jgi:serine/threonine protein kinase/tetratricopeptide (TPR) repeat protein
MPPPVAQDPSHLLQRGDVFAGCQVAGYLGGGAMGQVYLVYEPLDPAASCAPLSPLRPGADVREEALGDRYRRAALKVIRQDTCLEDQREHLLLEAHTAAAVVHPNVVSVFRVSEAVLPRKEEHCLYLLMEYCPVTLQGELDARRARGQLFGSMEVVEVGLAVSRALSAMRSEGVLHRDIKPDNIVGRPDPTGGWQWKVADFGVAHRLREGVEAEQIGGVVGTPPFIAWEVWQGGEVGTPADLYSLGVTLHLILTGGFPYPSAKRTAWGWLEAQQRQRRDPCKLSFPDEVLPPLAACVQSMLDLDASRRPQHPALVYDELESCRMQLAAGRAAVAIKPPPPPPPVGLSTIPLPAPADRASPPLVGRRDALRHLEGSLRLVRQKRRGRMLVLTGPRGVGRSRLLEETARRIGDRDLRVLWASVERDHGADLQEGLLRDLFQLDLDEDPEQRRERLSLELGRLLGGLGVAQAWEALQALIARPLGAGSDTDGLGGRGLSPAAFSPVTVADMLRASSARRPLLLLLDQVERAGGADLELLTALARQCEHAPLMLVVACREGSRSLALERLAAEPSVQWLALPRLTLEEVSRVAARALGPAPQPALAEHLIPVLASRACGLPALPALAVRRALERGVMRVVGDRVDGDFLAAQEVVDEVLAELTIPPAQPPSAGPSHLGRSLEALRGQAPSADPDRDPDERFNTGEFPVEFEDGEELEERDATELVPVPAEIWAHMSATERVRALLERGERLWALSELRGAARVYQAALMEIRPDVPPETCARAGLALVRTLRLLGICLEQGLPFLDRSVELADRAQDPLLRLESQLERVRILTLLGQVPQAHEVLQALVPLVEALSSPPQTTSPASSGHDLWRLALLGEEAHARGLVASRMALIEGRPRAAASPPPGRVQLFALEEIGLDLEPSWDRKARQALEQARSLAASAQARNLFAQVCQSLGDHLLRAGDLDQAEAKLRESLQLKTTLGDRPGLAMTRGSLARLATARGEWDQAIEHYQHDLEISQAIGGDHGVSLVGNSLGELYEKRHEVGEPSDPEDLDRAQESFRVALRAACRAGNALDEALAELYQGRFLSRSRCQHGPALEFLERAVRTLRVLQHADSKILAVAERTLKEARERSPGVAQPPG